MRETLDLLGKLFQYRTCEGPEPGRRSGSPCLDYYIKRCGAPCVGYIDSEEYRRNIEAIVDFLSGRYRQVERDLEEKMEEAAAAQEFERAAVHRDRLKAIRSLFERQRVAGESVGTADLIGVAVEGADANAQVFQVRDGILAERQSFYLDNQGERELAEVAEEFIGQYYSASPAVPRHDRRRALPARARRAARRGAQRARAAPPVEVRAAERGDKRRLRELAERNARLALDQDQLRREHRRQRRIESLSDAARGARDGGAADPDRGLRHLQPRRRAHGRLDGRLRGRRDEEVRLPPLPDPRRPARGRPADGGDDFASMEEVLAAAAQPLPRAGGPLAARRRARRELRLASLADRDRRRQGPARGRDAGAAARSSSAASTVARLAKRLEEVYVPGRSAPLDLAADSEASQLLQRVRDEAHRFAIEHHRGRRDRAMTGSVLDELQGVGPGAQAGPAAALRLAGAVPRRHPRGARGGARGSWQSRPRHPRAAEQDRLMADPQANGGEQPDPK